MKHQPFQQGDLDGFCGAYCIVNAIHFLCGPLNEDHAGKIFYKSMRQLNTRKPILRRINEGTRMGEVAWLLDIFKRQYPIHVEKPFSSNSQILLQEYWQCTQAFLRDRKGIVLQGIDGHWTLVKAVTTQSLVLFDSDGLKQIFRIQCTTSKDVPLPYIIIPNRTYFIWTDTDEGGPL